MRRLLAAARIQMASFPILEFDPDPAAIIQPQPPVISRPAPPRAVFCFFSDLLQSMATEGRLEEIGHIGSEMGRLPFYLLRVEGADGEREVLVVQPGIGSAFAAAILEEVIALGVRQVIACGGCGVLDPNIAAGHPVVLTAAVRDEGVSYHYLPPGREALPHPKAVQALEAACASLAIDYRRGKAWTTDAFYRETPARRALRLAEGCEVVEMEAAAFFAVAQFRQIVFGQVVYGGDLVVPEGWDSRSWNSRTDDRRLMFELAVDACLRLDDEEE